MKRKILLIGFLVCILSSFTAAQFNSDLTDLDGALGALSDLPSPGDYGVDGKAEQRAAKQDAPAYGEQQLTATGRFDKFTGRPHNPEYVELWKEKWPIYNENEVLAWDTGGGRNGKLIVTEVAPTELHD